MVRLESSKHYIRKYNYVILTSVFNDCDTFLNEGHALLRYAYW